MVFSNELDGAVEKLGFGIAVPCKAKVCSAQDLIEEAEALWQAESLQASRLGTISASWGSVALSPVIRQSATFGRRYGGRPLDRHAG